MNIQSINRKATSKKYYTIHDCRLIDLPNFSDKRGCLVAIESGDDIPFDFKRLFFISGLDVNSCRGGHAHITLSEVIICLSGSLEVNLQDGQSSKTYVLDDKRKGLYLPPTIWATEKKFTTSTIYLVLASDNYKPSDYVRDYTKFETMRKSIWQ